MVVKSFCILKTKMFPQKYCTKLHFCDLFVFLIYKQILCLQEVQEEHFYNWFHPRLKEYGELKDLT